MRMTKQTEVALARPLHADQESLKKLRWHMLRFASSRLPDTNLAEDAVQEALIGALRNDAMYAGRAAWKSWVFGILRHKINDALRSSYQHNEISLNALDHGGDDFPIDDDLRSTLDQWQCNLWRGPEASLSGGQFVHKFKRCLDELPDRQANAYLMYELSNVQISDICALLDLSVSNFHVLVYRTRLHLRRRLDYDGYF